MFLRCPSNNTHRSIPRGVVVHLSFIPPLQLFHLVLALVEHLICASRGGIRRDNLCASEEEPRVAECRGQCIRGPIEDRASAATGYRGYVEGLCAPGGAAGERGVALKVDGDAASGHIISEMGEGMRVGIGIGLCTWAAVPENKPSVCGDESWTAALGEGAQTFDVNSVS